MVAFEPAFKARQRLHHGLYSHDPFREVRFLGWGHWILFAGALEKRDGLLNLYWNGQYLSNGSAD